MEFDILGRVKRSIQTTDDITYGGGTDESRWMTYDYNLSGALVEQQYPSGRKVRNELDESGNLALVQSRKNENHAYWSYANHFSYNASGAVTSMQLGNGRWESTQFNSRLQPTQIALGKTQNATDLLRLDYQYGDLQWNGSVDPQKNNGNVGKQTITVPSVGATAGFIAVQNYDYDSLNRIQIASETLTPTSGPAESWVQEFRYDRFGNRTFHEPTTTTLPKECGTAPNLTVCPGVVPIVNPSANPANNKLNGYSFDDAGNTTRDAENRKFTYDAENKQVKVETLTGEFVTGRIGEYWYDGDGKRIKKRGYTNNVLTEETIFLYDASGKLIGEYSNQVASAQDAKIAYLTNDHLGSPRINTDINGNVTSRHDYHPFGEEVASTKRVAAIGYAEDTIRKQFTGYERDGDTGLDFAQARYYSNGHGRFTSTDPLAGGRGNPQSLNRYVYVGNRPLVFVDPKGLEWVNKDDRPIWVKPDEYAKQKEKGTALPLWDQDRMKYGSGEGTVILDPRGPNPETPWGWTLDSVAVGDPNEPALDPSVPGENRVESTATDVPPMAMSSSGDPRRNWFFIYQDAHARRSRAQALFPDSRGLDAERHRWATRQTALRWGTGTARTLGVLNEFQGFIFHDLFALPSTFEGRRDWAFQWSDLQHNERGINEANIILSQPKNNVPK